MTVGALASKPVPVSLTLCDVRFAASVTMFRLAVRASRLPPGVNVTSIAHDAPAASVAGQPLLAILNAAGKLAPKM